MLNGFRTIALCVAAVAALSGGCSRNDAVQYAYVIDRNSGQWKAPYNEISNEHRVFTYADTSVVTPNSDTPYSMGWLDLRWQGETPPGIDQVFRATTDFSLAMLSHAAV